jgi:hypothetical protein
MPGWVRRAGLLLLQLAAIGSAFEMSLVRPKVTGSTLWHRADEFVQDQSESSRQVCSGMYSRKSWGGSMDPFILTNFIKPKQKDIKGDPLISLVVFEWNDKNLIGQPVEGQGPGAVSIEKVALEERTLIR